MVELKVVAGLSRMAHSFVCINYKHRVYTPFHFYVLLVYRHEEDAVQPRTWPSITPRNSGYSYHWRFPYDAGPISHSKNGTADRPTTIDWISYARPRFAALMQRSPRKTRGKKGFGVGSPEHKLAVARRSRGRIECRVENSDYEIQL